MAEPDPDPRTNESRPELREGSGATGNGGGIPEQPEGSPQLAQNAADSGDQRPLSELPAADFWQALYTRRSIRKFRPDPVPRELIDQVMHAGIWAPSSCNYQMWDLVAVDDPDVNARLARLSLQMGNAPVNVVVAYGRGFSEENHANIQSASALIQNMSLAAQVLGLGTFWITQTGDSEKLREIVGLPPDRMVVAVLALGYPKLVPKKGPKRRPLAQVTHYNHYAGRPIPSSVDPEDWDPDLLAIYQRARVLNGLRHNKARAWEVQAIESCLERLLPEGSEGRKAASEPAPRWLDVLPCTGIVTELLSRRRPGFCFDVVERTPEVAGFAAGRIKPRAGVYAWPDPGTDFPAPEQGAYDRVSCFFRLEGLRTREREALLAGMASWLRPGGRMLIGYVSRRSFHAGSERLRAKRGGPGGVEYVLSPDPGIGPFRALVPEELERSAAKAGLKISARLALQAAPGEEEVDFRARNFSPRSRRLATLFGRALRGIEYVPGLRSRYARFRFLLLEAS